MKRLYLILMFFLTLACPSFAQQDNTIIARINEIKLDSLMLYGEATEKDMSVAETYALKDLQDSFEEYRKQHENVKLDSLKIEILKHPRGNNTRVFAYISADSLLTVQNLIPTDYRQFEMDVSKICNTTEMAMLISGQYSSSVSYGVVDLSTDDRLISVSYIFVVKEPEGEIIEIYSPFSESNTRKSIRSGKYVKSISFRPDNTIYWLTFNTDIPQ